MVTVKMKPIKRTIRISAEDAESAKAVKDVKLEIVAAEDIKAADGTVRYPSGKVVEKLTTNDKGSAESKELYIGKYSVKQASAPKYYAVDPKAVAASVTEDSGTDKGLIKIDCVKTKVTVTLTDERTEKPIKGAVYELEGKDELTTDSNGQITITDLNKSTGYKLNVKSVPKGYHKKSKELSFKVEELGVDQLFIDDAHLFKNLFIYTKMTNVAGVGSGSESGRASDLYGKSNYLDQFNPGRGVVFATGTPIANTMSEMFTMQRYLQPHTLKAMGLMNFDSWATTFGETVTALEIAPEGKGYRAKTRFAKFNNIPELMAMFKEVADVQTSETLKLPVPEVKREIVEIQPTEEQKSMIEDLGERAEQIRMKRVEPDEDNILKIISDGKAIALDPRILDAENVGGGKVYACAEKVYEIWAQSSDQTQLIFSDLSTPTGKKSKGDDAFCAYEEIKKQLVPFQYELSLSISIGKKSSCAERKTMPSKAK